MPQHMSPDIFKRIVTPITILVLAFMDVSVGFRIFAGDERLVRMGMRRIEERDCALRFFYLCRILSQAMDTRKLVF
jgi:hypothetical protein